MFMYLRLQQQVNARVHAKNRAFYGTGTTETPPEPSSGTGFGAGGVPDLPHPPAGIA